MRLWAAVLVLVASSAAAAAAESEPLLYTRADVISAATGEVSFRRAYTKQLELLSATCEGDVFTCSADQMYREVYLLGFVEETSSRGEDGKPSTERRDRGRLAIATSFPKEQETAFEDALSAHLRQRGVPEFGRPQGGMSFLDKPLEQSVLEESVSPAWLCAELDGAWRYDAVVNGPCPKQKPGEPPRRSTVRCVSTFSGGGERAKTLCGRIERAARDVDPTVLRTMPHIRAQLRHEVHLVSVSTLSGRTWADRMAKVPEGATFTKAKLDEGTRIGGVRDVRDGMFRGHEGRYGGVEVDARLPNVRLELEGVPMWVARFTFERTREVFGEAPSVQREPDASLLVAVAPVADPLMNDLDRGRTELFVPDDRVLEAAVARFERSATLEPGMLSEVLADPEVWPAAGSWMVVTCRDDGSARWGIAPFAEAAEVTNAREACAAIRREIGD